MDDAMANDSAKVAEEVCQRALAKDEDVLRGSYI